MKISKKEAEILACVELDAEKPIDLLRKETGYRDHTIRYALHSLQARGVIRPLPFVNLFALGYNIYNIFFSLGIHNRKVREELTKALIATRPVTWLAEMSAEYPLALGITTKSMHEVHELLNALSRRFKGAFFEKSVSAQFATVLFAHKYLSKKRFKSATTVMTRPKQTYEADELDLKIMNGLSNIPHRSRRELAQKLAIPLSTLELRIKKLEKAQVITGYFYSVDCTKIGLQSYKLIIYGRGIDPDFSLALLKFAEAHPSIVYMMECFGSWDYELNVEVENPEDIVGITQELYEFGAAQISQVKVLSKFRDLKMSMFPS